MAGLLHRRERGDLPYCEVVLGNGDRVAITLSAGGVRIDLLGWAGIRAARLFRGDADMATSICVGLLDGKPPRSTTPLEILARAVARLPSAVATRDAFAAAARTQTVPRASTSSRFARAVALGMALTALTLTAMTVIQIMVRPPN